MSASRSPRRCWAYRPAACQEILPPRTENSIGDAIFVKGVGEGHRAIDVPTGE
ncbi:hypothetical protein AB0O34_13275 [Sphaerisporangium sp. NPDC088356]|uniref:hypothetical protein n=1 Tax=Sphaerisporangium sp. NPDC088356 TaxID=3154871 RepID=UPI003436B1DF